MLGVHRVRVGLPGLYHCHYVSLCHYVSMCHFLQEVVSFLQDFKAVDILTGVIAKSQAPRATVSGRGRVRWGTG